MSLRLGHDAVDGGRADIVHSTVADVYADSSNGSIVWRYSIVRSGKLDAMLANAFFGSGKGRVTNSISCSGVPLPIVVGVLAGLLKFDVGCATNVMPCTGANGNHVIG